MTTIDLTDRVTPLLQSVPAALRDGGVEKVMERALVNEVKDHLFTYNAAHPNRLGGQRTNFYAQAAKSTHGKSQPGEVEVTISQVGIRQRIEGGTITAHGKLLTIPAIPEAHGKRASEFHNLRFAAFHGPNTVGALVGPGAVSTGIAIGRKFKGKQKFKAVSSEVGVKVFFWLAKSINQVGDPDVLPSRQKLIDVAMAGATTHLALREARLRGGANA